MENSIGKNLIIVVLIVIAVILGFLIFQRVGDQTTVDTSDVSNTSSEENVANDQSQETGDFVDTRDLSSLSSDEKAVLKVPSNGTDEERQGHFNLAVSLAKDTSSVDIAGCVGDPVVARVSSSNQLFVTNSDSLEHTIIFDQDNSFIVPAGGQVSIESVFSKGAGLYGYGCNNNPGVTGLFLVTE